MAIRRHRYAMLPLFRAIDTLDIFAFLRHAMLTLRPRRRRQKMPPCRPLTPLLSPVFSATLFSPLLSVDVLILRR